MSSPSWLLGGGYPWRSADPSADRPGPASGPVVASPAGGLSLAALPRGPLGLLASDDSLGGLTLPRGVALDDGTVFVLSDDGARVYRYDPVRATLVALAQLGVDGLSPGDDTLDEPRRFRDASNIAALGGILYVADPKRERVQVFDHATLALLRIHGGLVDPVDVAAGARSVYVLDRGAGRIYRATPDGNQWTVVVALPECLSPEATCAERTRRRGWDRVAVDRDGRVYVRLRRTVTGADGALREDVELEVFDVSSSGPATLPIERWSSPEEIRDRFATPEIRSGAGDEIVLPERLRDPCGLRRRPADGTSVFAVQDRLYVFDRERRVVDVLLGDGRRRHRFGPYNGIGIVTTADAEDAWSPEDVVALPGCAAILDTRHRIVYAHQLGTETLRRWFAAPPDSGARWRRIASDGRGCLLLWDGTGADVDRVAPDGRPLGTVPIAKARGFFAREATAPALWSNSAEQRFSRRGASPRPPSSLPALSPALYERSGLWTSGWLDSDLYDCRWHVLEISVAALPPGSRVKIRTRTSNHAQSAAEVLAAATVVGAQGSWRDLPLLSAVAQPSEEEAKPHLVDFLVPNGPGRYLQLQIELAGDGVATPVLRSLRIRFPRESLLEYLPAIYSKPDDQREFLDRFLSIPQATWSKLEHEVETFERNLDPDSVPAEWMEYLAGWLDVRLEGTWTPEQNRRLLQAMPRLRARWGTVAGLRAWIQVYLSNLSGWSPEDLEAAGIPGIVESFVERRAVMLGRPDVAVLGATEQLYGPSIERRFQIGVFDRESEVELVSTGDPDLDFFRRTAHAFRVHVPAAWVRSPQDEALLRRAIEAQKPAHTTYELVLLDAGFRIGVQSTLDLDAVIGAPTPGRIACPAIEDPPSRPPHGRLGYDTVLGVTVPPRAGSVERTLD